jgi:hypothetical protein
MVSGKPSEFCSLSDIAPCMVRPGSRVALQFGPTMNRTNNNLVAQRSEPSEQDKLMTVEQAMQRCASIFFVAEEVRNNTCVN